MRPAFLSCVVIIFGLTACSESVEQAVQGLNDADPQRRQAAARSLAGRVDAASADSLLPLLSDPDAAVRSAAIESLATVTDPHLIARLATSLIESPVGGPNLGAAEALPVRWGEPALEALLRPLPPYAPPGQEARLMRMLAPFRDARAVRVIAARLGRPEPLRSAALESLQVNPEAGPFLARALADATTEAERLIAAAALVRLGERDRLEELIERALISAEHDLVGNLLSGIGEISTEDQSSILAALGSPDPVRQHNAAIMAGALGIADAAPALLEILVEESRDPLLRAAAAASLGQLQYAAAAAPLVDVLIAQFEREMDPWDDEGCEEVEPDVFECAPTEQGAALKDLERAALGSLPRLGPAMVEPLLSALMDGGLAHPNLKGELEPGHEILRVFSAAGEETLDAVLHMAESHPEPVMVEAAVTVIEHIGGKRGAEVMIGLLASDDDWKVELAAKALETLADPDAVRPLVAALPRLQPDYVDIVAEWDRRYPNPAARALVAIGRPSAEAVRQSLTANEPPALAPAAWVSAWLRDQEAAGDLLRLFDHADELVRDSACLALGALRYRPALEPILERVGEVLGTDEQHTTLPVLFRALGMLRDPRAVPLLQEMAQDEDLFWDAMPALAEIPDEAVEKQLKAALEAEDLRTVAAAYRFYIRNAVAGSEAALIAALDEYVDADRALDYLNSGNPRLAAAGREWLEAHDYLIFEGSGEAGLKWGSQ